MTSQSYGQSIQGMVMGRYENANLDAGVENYLTVFLKVPRSVCSPRVV
jgi:hypothetical protein